MTVNFLFSHILCSYVNCKSTYVGGNKVIYTIIQNLTIILVQYRNKNTR